MSLGSLLSIARSALMVSQRSMEVTGHNVANANTVGYSRQRLNVQAASPLQMPLYSLGRGVEANQITRSRDTFYDATFRSESGSLGRSNTMSSYMSQIEASLNEPSSNGLSSALDGMFSAFSDLSSDPASHTNREMVLSAANRVTAQLHSMTTQLSRMKQESTDNMKVQVGEVNSIAAKIAQLNQQIAATTGPGGPSSDLMDQRDVLIDQLSNYMSVRTLTNSDGSLNVATGDIVLVSGAQSVALAVVNVGSGLGVAPAGGGPAIDPVEGSLKALADLTQTKIPSVQSSLDQLAASLVTEFNAIHRAGFTPAGGTNVDFFDPARTTAGTIDLSAALKATSDNVAASANGIAGNGGIAAQLAALATTGVASLGGNTFREHFVSLASGVGLDVSNSQKDVDAQATLVDRADQVRNSISGVNVDEEMVSLITQQQAYQAAARIVSVADQMMQTLLTLLGP
jgi:flagellar hook-associated protein 1 FlgK